MSIHEYEIILPIDPISWNRPGLDKKKGLFYDTQSKEKKIIKLIISSLLNKKNITTPIVGPVGFEVVFHITPPCSLSNKKKQALLGEYHIKKPDVDNLLKFLLDCGTGLIYNDDCQVAKESGIKIYAEKPEIKIKVTNLGKK